MKKIKFKKTGILLVMILVAGAVPAMPVSAAEAKGLSYDHDISLSVTGAGY